MVVGSGTAYTSAPVCVMTGQAWDQTLYSPTAGPDVPPCGS